MKRLLLIACVALALGVAACSGGGSTGGTPPTAPPTSTPTTAPVSYSARLIFTGALAGKQEIQSDLSRVPQSGDATPVPIMVVLPVPNSGGTIGGTPSNSFGGTVSVEVSPMPSSVPSITFTNTNGASVLQTPNPSASPTALPSGVIYQANVFGDPNATTQGSGVVSANIGSPVNASPTTAIYAYASISLECTTPMSAGSAPAWKWDATTSAWEIVSTIADADVYLTGPACNIPGFVTTETWPTLHVPGGGTMYVNTMCFCDLVAASEANSGTAFDLHAVITFNPDHSQNSIFEGRTRDGSNVFALYPNSLGSYPGEYSGAAKVSGHSPDDF